MFDDAALALEEIEPEDKTRKEVWGPLRARALHQENDLIEFNLACYASVTRRFKDAKIRLWHAIEIDKEDSQTGAR